MKKYKLIKEYPGSPKLGTIITPTNGYGMTYLDVHAHKYPEFWQEVIEKDYEILSFYDKTLKCLFTNIGNDRYSSPYKDLDLDWLLFSHEYYTIHSVKRLSDSEVFTVGDRIQYYNITGEKSHTHVISDITIYENKILLNHNHGTWKSHGDFNKVQKVKQPLFTTEDGVDIYEGDRYYSLSINEKSKYPWSIAGPYINPKACDPTGDILYFSTKESAEEYILMNKSKYSINDILASLPNRKCEKYTSIKQMIENLKNM